MKTKDAVERVMKTEALTAYGLGKALGMSPTSVSQWLVGTRMSTATAEKFTKLYGIEIDDTFSTSTGTS